MAPSDSNKPQSGLWKDYVNRRLIVKMAEEIGQVDKEFDQSAFADTVVDDSFYSLELKERISAIAHALNQFLPDDYDQAMQVFREVAPKLGGFENWALMAYIELYGLDHFEASVAALRDLTQYSSAEFAIRPYVLRYEKEMLPVLHRWAEDSNHHVRRLAAEGSRPRGVWTAHVESFKNDPRPVLELLEKLKADSSLYVRKAVANNLNDISKDHPDLVIETALNWQKDGDPNTEWIIKHACRSLIKRGNPRVFPLLGFTPSPEIKIEQFRLSPATVKIGGSMAISFSLVSQSQETQKLAVDYRIHYIKKSGKPSAKVFKLSEKTIDAGADLNIKTNHSFENRSTRTHYPGLHRLDLIVNGDVAHTEEFTLTV